MNICRSLVLLSAFAAVSAFAGIAYVNDLLPFDNTIDDGYWRTTGHPLRSVQVETRQMSGDFDSRACSVVCVDLESFSTLPSGTVIVIH